MLSIPNEPYTIGIDVAKDHLDVATFPQPSHHQYRFTTQSIQRLITKFKDLPPQRIVLEATGGLEQPIARALYQAGLPIIIANPRTTHSFAKATGALAKTDRIDAHLLAQYAHQVQPPIRLMKTDEQRLLDHWLKRRHQLVHMMVQEKNRFKKTEVDFLRDDIKDHLTDLKQRLDLVDAKLRALIAENDAWQRRDQILHSVPGIGDVTANELIAGLPELGELNHKQLAAIVGLAPFNRDSGHHEGKRAIYGGRKAVRCAFYMATLTAIRSDERIGAYYRQLKGRGKPSKVAIVACMRKMLTIINALVRDDQCWGEPPLNM